MKCCRVMAVLFVLGCSPDQHLSTSEFNELMNTLASAWSRLDTEAAVACFTSDATYMQPPDEQFYQGHDQLRSYFGALKSGTYLQFHHLWFDEAAQTGAVEFTFGNTANDQADTGVIIITVRDKKIAQWREYFIKGPADFEKFISPENKNWKWTIENYP